MKAEAKSILSSLILVAGLTGATIAHADQRDFRVVNNTGKTINRMYVAPTNDPDTVVDMLGRYVVPDGYEKRIAFNSDAVTSCYFNWEAVLADGSTIYSTAPWNFCRTNVLELNPHTFRTR